MNNLIFKALAGILLVVGTAPASHAAAWQKSKDAKPLARLQKASPRHQRWSDPIGYANTPNKISPAHSTPKGDSFQYLYGPDGTEWYAIGNNDYERVELEGGVAYENILKGYSFTIYDNNFNEIGTIRDAITLEGDETRCAQAELCVTVTRKFFNYDDKYEVMIALSMNTPSYNVNMRTKVYAIGGEKDENGYDIPLTTIAGYPVDAVNCATDRWTEDFYITFLTEHMPDPDNYSDYLAFLGDCKNVLTTYTKAKTNDGVSVLFEHETGQLNLPGDQMTSPMMLCKNVGGAMTLIYAQYEKSLFVDPTGMGEDDSLTPDNNLIIDVYQVNNNVYPRTVDHICTTKIPAIQSENEKSYYTFYGIGTLGYDKDVDFVNYTDDGSPAFIVTKDEYMIDDDDNYNSSYYVYNSSGEKILTLAENTFNYVMMSDIHGFEPQAMFIDKEEMVFRFVDLYSGHNVMEVDQMYRGYGLSTTIDRVMTSDGYVYADAISSGTPYGDNSLAAPVIWLDTNGEMIRLDEIPCGEGVELAQTYIASDALNPYVFNTDSDMEYMLLVKRRVGGDGDPLREELIIATPEKGPIQTFLPDPEKGNLRMVYLMNLSTPQLILAYLDDDYRFTADSYSLPFTKFAGGNGTASDPYRIATAGDLKQIGTDLSASYKLVNDIDCGGISFKAIDNFSGTLDGDGHVISHLSLYGNGKVGLFATTENATFKNLNFYDCSIDLEGDSEAAVMATTSMATTFENIHVRRLNVTGDTFKGIFGGISGRNWRGSSVSECEVTGADINLPSCPSVGGIVGEIRTGSNVTACVFSGKINADNTVGGIVATTTTGDEIISNCHVDADLKARNTVGGIVGFLDRSKVTHNYVEGTIEVTEASKWTNALAAGGIAGELEGDWEGKADIPVVANLIGLSAIIYPPLDEIPEAYPHQAATVHRVVGRSAYNAEPEIASYDAEGNPIYKDETRYEEGIYNNLVLSTLPVIDSDFAEKTLEGTTVEKEEIDDEMLSASLGFTYGTSASAPWNIQAWYAYDPSLWYENAIYVPSPSMTVVKDKTFDIEVAILLRDTLSEEDIIDSFMCEFDESVLEMTGEMSYDGSTLLIGFKGINEGSSYVSVSVMGSYAGCNVEVVKEGSGVGTVSSEALRPVYSEGYIQAEGCIITVYDIDGRKVASGRDILNVRNLGAGVYAAVSIDSNGNSSVIKFAR